MKDNIQWWLEPYQNGIQEEWFREYQQNARIYLDEYSEQKDLRDNWLMSYYTD